MPRLAPKDSPLFAGRKSRKDLVGMFGQAYIGEHVPG